MTTQAKIIAFYNLFLLLGSFFLLFIFLPLILAVGTPFGWIILTFLMLFPIIWGATNSIRYLLGKPVAIKSLKRWEQILVMVPLLNAMTILCGLGYILVNG